VGECFFWYRPTRVVPDQRPLNGRCLRDFMHIYHGRWPVSWNVSQWGEYGMLSVLQRLGISYGFYLCNTMLARVLAKALCLSICVCLCVSQVGVLSKGMNGLI